MKSILPALLLCGAAALSSGAQNKLLVEQSALAQYEDGTPLPAGYQFLPGETIFFSCHVTGFAKNAGDAVFLLYTIEVRDSMGVLALPPENGKVAEHLSAEDRHWSPKIRYRIPLPAFAAGGEYHISVQVKDQFGHASADQSFAFEVQGAGIASSSTLAVRNFHFYRGERDKQPLEVAAYRPGDAVWARFFMTGYQFGPGNAFDIDYGIQVLRPNGETTYQQPEAASERHGSFYPQRYTPGSLSLTLPKDLAKGSYTVILTVRDNLAGKKTEQRETFNVE